VKFIVERGSSSISYNGRYQLAVQRFDVVDGNEDGIVEPGEHIFVRNIHIINTGKRKFPACLGGCHQT